MPAMDLAPNIAAAAVCSIVSLMLISWAYARAEAKVLIPVEYTAFVWAAIFGAVFFAESLTVTTVFGAALIVTGCLVAAWQKPDQVDHVENTVV